MSTPHLVSEALNTRTHKHNLSSLVSAVHSVLSSLTCCFSCYASIEIFLDIGFSSVTLGLLQFHIGKVIWGTHQGPKGLGQEGGMVGMVC